jgi:hypothetical protein
MCFGTWVMGIIIDVPNSTGWGKRINKFSKLKPPIAQGLRKIYRICRTMTI